MWVMTSVETLGYSRPSLRDEEGQILVALDILVGLFVWPRMGNIVTRRQECRRSAGPPITRECAQCGQAGRGDLLSRGFV